MVEFGIHKRLRPVTIAGSIPVSGTIIMICIKCKKEYNNNFHYAWCNKDRFGKNNPHYGKKGANQYTYGAKMSDISKKKLSDLNLGKIQSDGVKKRISDSMKKAQKEGRAWNIGMNRWKLKPSYPESFFKKVIQNQFNDKKFIYEYPINQSNTCYSIDFAWLHKKKAIEIDGKQHEEKEQKERDIRKDIFLKQNGWKVLRIKWSILFKNTKQEIEKANKFIGPIT